MSRTTVENYPQRRGCSIGSDITVTGTPTPKLIETEADALLMHWQRMMMVTLESQPLDIPKLSFCLERLRFWAQHLEITR